MSGGAEEAVMAGTGEWVCLVALLLAWAGPFWIGWCVRRGGVWAKVAQAYLWFLLSAGLVLLVASLAVGLFVVLGWVLGLATGGP